MNKLAIFLGISFITLTNLSGQAYNLVWEENFDGNTLDSSTWNIEEREGIWNTAQNAEQQFYKTENVSVGDDGYGNNCLIINTLKESANGYSFTSGRVNTNSKFSFKYGKLEARIKIPDLKNGLWPAFWTEGYTSLGWPDKGEIDILEMGHSEGIALDTVNSYLSSATHWEYNDSRADYGTHILAPVNLSDDYHLYTLVWTPQSIKTYLDDTKLIFSFSLTGNDLEEYKSFRNFIIINMAAGGILPGITLPDQITAPLPAKMFVDYIKLYQVDGEGSFVNGSDTIEGKFGVYSENNLSGGMNSKFDSEIITNGLVETISSKYEGFQTLAFTTQAATDFSISINSLVERNMSRYQDGGITFAIKTDATQDLALTFADKSGGTSSLTLNPSKYYNPDRNNSWDLVTVPVNEFSGSVDFTQLITLFNIQATGSSGSAYFAIDNIIWDEVYTGSSALQDQFYGIYADHTSITAKLDFGSSGHLYVWNGFTAAPTTPVYGKTVIGFKANTTTWNGIGLQSDLPINLSEFSTGSLNMYFKTASSQEFSIGFQNMAGNSYELKYPAGVSTANFKRDGKWHLLNIPLSNFIPMGNAPALSPKSMEEVTILLKLVGTINFSMDEVYFSRSDSAIYYGLFETSVIDKSYPGIEIYPVPAKNILMIKGIKSNSSIEIRSITGKLMEKTDASSDFQMDISGYNPGIYLVSIQSGNEIINKKVIVE